MKMSASAAPGGADPAHPVVIVTGAARGLGRAMTLSLLRNGARVAAADLPSSAAEMQELVALATAEHMADRLFPVDCDVSQWAYCQAAVRKVADHFGAVHGLVNNAGLGMQHIGHVLKPGRKRFYEVEADTWRASIDVNFNGPFLMAKAVSPLMVEQGWGRIVNIVTSFYTMMMEGFSPYGPTKAALESATVIWSKDLASTGVTVNALLPGGAANTRMIPEGDIDDRSKLIQPEVMMAPIAWLMSARSNGVTGRRIIASEWSAERLNSEPAASVGGPAGW